MGTISFTVTSAIKTSFFAFILLELNVIAIFKFIAIVILAIVINLTWKLQKIIGPRLVSFTTRKFRDSSLHLQVSVAAKMIKLKNLNSNSGSDFRLMSPETRDCKLESKILKLLNSNFWSCQFKSMSYVRVHRQVASVLLPPHERTSPLRI